MPKLRQQAMLPLSTWSLGILLMCSCAHILFLSATTRGPQSVRVRLRVRHAASPGDSLCTGRFRVQRLWFMV